MKPRLGMIIPDDGPLDYELYRLAPWLEFIGLDIEVITEDSATPGVEVSATSTRLESCLRETGSDGVLLPCADKLTERGCTAIAWACTSGSFIGGFHWARTQADRLRGRSGLPSTSTTLAIIEAIRALDCNRVDVLSSYPAFITGRFVATLAQAGIEVVQTIALECDPADGIAKYANYVIELDLMAALRTFESDRGEGRPIIVPNTSMNTLTLVEAMEEAAGRVVVTANQATIWHSLRILKRAGVVRGVGRLLEVS